MLKGGALETARTIIRPFRTEDVDRLVHLFADPDVARFVDDGAPLPREQAQLWVEKSAENLGRYGYGTGAVVARSNARVIGWAGFARPIEGGEEIIYGLARDCWGEGLGNEILAALVHFALDQRMPRVRATVDSNNARSIALLVRHQFERVARSYDVETYSRNLR